MENKVKILIAEDDVNLARTMSAYLSDKGYMVTHCTNGEDAYEAFCKDRFDLCLLDIMMPIKDGFTLAQDIRKNNHKIPIIFISAKNSPEDMIHGLNLGADDFIPKPFILELLYAKINAVLRRTYQKANEELQSLPIGKYTFFYTRQVLEFNGSERKLTSKEAELLFLLLSKRNEILERSFTLKKIWGDDSYYNARSMDVYVTKIRKYLKEDPNIDLINVHGVGFKLVITK